MERGGFSSFSATLVKYDNLLSSGCCETERWTALVGTCASNQITALIWLDLKSRKSKMGPL